MGNARLPTLRKVAVEEKRERREDTREMEEGQEYQAQATTSQGNAVEGQGRTRRRGGRARADRQEQSRLHTESQTDMIWSEIKS
jgi:hypothetical protein